MGGRWRGVAATGTTSSRADTRERERETSEGGGGVMTDDGGVPPLMLMSEMMETAAVGFHGGNAADHGGGSLFISDGTYDDVALDRVQTTLANRSDFIRVNSDLLGSVSQSTQSAG
ncbi:hypothetical protein HanHA89_Chr07g0250081 [Helianthus annuus]|nr:hypothetical protein HanHA89_Chr07g0250081 [Helianthus annuus]